MKDLQFSIPNFFLIANDIDKPLNFHFFTRYGQNKSFINYVNHIYIDNSLVKAVKNVLSVIAAAGNRLSRIQHTKEFSDQFCNDVK